MIISRNLKSSALAAIVVLATVGASFAATGWMEKNTKVRNQPNGAVVVNLANAGDKVQVVNQVGSWYKIKIPGQDGWVKKNRVSFDNPEWDNGWGNGWGNGGGAGGAFCINGKQAQFCIGAHN